MCGIFGVVSKTHINKQKFQTLVKHSEQRGVDSSGLIYYQNNHYKVNRADYSIEKLLNKVQPYNNNIVLGHSRLITNGLGDNQPVVRGNICAIHNGIIVNEDEVWNKLSVSRQLKIDSEVIVAIAEEFLNNKENKIEDLPKEILSLCKGVVACALVLPEIGKLLLFSNNGSLYVGYNEDKTYFASENYGLKIIGCENISQIKDEAMILDIPVSGEKLDIVDEKSRVENLIPEFKFNTIEEGLLEYKKINIKRCTKCILPETMPFIKFDEAGVCNYCKNYKPRNNPKPKEELFKLVEPYRRKGKELDCIVPFSGGRDSCYGLHLIVKELEMKPVTYTYDWGMVTDLGRRNISRMCADLGVENIIVAADISLKRKNIRMNLEAWLKAPHLGMMAMLTAGDKHFFRYVEDIKKQTGINLNLWGVNPLEVTHFKTGFLDIEPDFEEKRVYSHGAMKQLRYHSKRFRAMMQSPGYFNSSLWDTLSGEYYRSFTDKQDYYHIFDYWRWDEEQVDDTLLNHYDWEKAIDTTTTWRIGDGTAAFYNYVYYTVAGFTEHDTFRSNQIREGQMTRERALELVEIENAPRYQNIRWYLDTLGLDFERVIKIVNNIPKLYKQ
ncbi:Glutamine amidotransferase domain-containing protein [Chryseobacterium rhizoplanae]|uniref:Glutamine--fructose-6-phosphate aminotransferase [isomerizing] n=1 Tax=Chryseobacterium rhizoplanae TaxID=1609531 RepID=A0A521CKE0_9FLAO|nr:glucosamine 6-phosphate synthetase [Chryseobacterium rhizoplanae]SMO59865.1 Glutamine amidotransferase domain-containing protein [Chryseobacterium rhizoplanae]